MLLQGYKKDVFLAVIKLHCVFMAAVDQCGAMLVLDMCTHLALSCTVAMIFMKMFKYGNTCVQKPFFDVKLSNRRDFKFTHC